MTERDAPLSGRAPPPAARLSVRRASKSYDGEAALVDVHLEVHAGEVHALMGENGAGKSTLIKLLAAVETPDALDVEVDGRPVALRTPSDAECAGFRFVHQELNVVPALSVAENLHLGHAYPRTSLGLIDWRELGRRAREALAGLGVDHIDPGAPMHRLGPGDAMLVSIARAFVGGPDPAGGTGIYVLDEPTAALSRRETETLFGVVRGLRSRGHAVLYVSHRMEEIFEIADRITVMREGVVVTTVATAETDRAALVRAMTGRDLSAAVRNEPVDAGSGAAVPVLEADGVRGSGLDAISFALRPGEVVGLTGLAGSGRTELLRMLIGADAIEGGTLRFEGRPVVRHDPYRAWRSGIAYVPEERRSQALVMSGDVRRNVLLPHLDRVVRFGFADRRTERLETEGAARAVGLRARGVDQPVRELSGGNQQKVVLARALAGEPKVLLLDEPTRGVDVGAKADIYALIRRAARSGSAVLMASSDLEEVLTVSDRVLVLHRGRLAFERDTADLDRGTLLSMCFGGGTA